MSIPDIRLTDTRSGKPTLSVDGFNIHSRFNPQVEAERFVASQAIEPGKIVVLFFPGLEYLYSVIENLHIASEVLVIQPSVSLFDLWNRYPPNAWTPDGGISLESFLSEKIAEHNFGAVQIVVWEPLMKAFPQLAQTLREQLFSVLSAFAANINTRTFFGKRWIWNLTANLLAFDAITPGYRSSGTAAIAASGPSLFDDWLAKGSSAENIIALPSSIRALRNRSIKASVLVNSDAGYYAARHLFYVDTEDPPLICSALRGMMRPFWHLDMAPLFWRVGLPFEDAFCSNVIDGKNGTSETYFMTLPDRGTVAISAMDIVQRFHDGPVLIRGFDLASRDLYMHIRPHTNENEAFALINRLKAPHHATYQARFSPDSIELGDGWWTQGSLLIYRDWVEKQGCVYQGQFRIVSHGASPKGLPAIPSRLVETEIEKTNASFEPFAVKTLVPRSRRIDAMSAIVDTILNKVSSFPVPERPDQELFDFYSYLSPFLHKSFLREKRTGNSGKNESAARSDLLSVLDSLKKFIQQWVS